MTVDEYLAYFIEKKGLKNKLFILPKKIYDSVCFGKRHKNAFKYIS